MTQVAYLSYSSKSELSKDITTIGQLCSVDEDTLR